MEIDYVDIIKNLLKGKDKINENNINTPFFPTQDNTNQSI